MCAKHYENPTMLSRVTAKNVGDVFLRHTVVNIPLNVAVWWLLRYSQNFDISVFEISEIAVLNHCHSPHALTFFRTVDLVLLFLFVVSSRSKIMLKIGRLGVCTRNSKSLMKSRMWAIMKDGCMCVCVCVCVLQINASSVL